MFEKVNFRTKNTILLSVISLMTLSISFPAFAAFGSGSVALERRVSKIENLLRNQLNIDNINRIELLQQEVQELRGLLEEQDYKIKMLTKKNSSDNIANAEALPVDDLEQQEQDLDSDVSLNNLNSPSNIPTAETPVLDDKIKAKTEDEKKFEKAYSALLSKDYDIASAMFSSFLWEYPESKLLPDAYFWLAEVNFVRYSEDSANTTAIEMAELNFLKLVNEYPQYPNTKNALLKLGIIAELSNNKDNAKFYFQRLINQYPNTSPAAIAKIKLDKI